MRAHVFFILLITSIHTWAANSIQVEKALWSGADVTKSAANFCNGKSSVKYKISRNFIGTPRDEQDRSFKIHWNCGSSTEYGEYDEADNAEGRFLNISCPIPSSALKTKQEVAPPQVTNTSSSSSTESSFKNAVTTEELINKHKTSLHAYIYDPAPDKVEEKVGYDCTGAIRQFLKNGGDFKSEVMLQKFTIPLSKFKNPNTQSGEFFHYTSAVEVRDAVKSGSIDLIFSFLRSKLIPDIENRWYWYVATDSNSSANYGPIKIKVIFDKESLVFTPGGTLSSGYYENSTVNELIEAEIIAKDRTLSVCAGRMDTPKYYSNGILSLLAAEASGIKLIAYFGIMNEMFPDDDYRKFQWLQIVGPWAIKRAEVSKY